MKFRTEVEIPEFKKKLSYRQQSLMVGSCFAENIGVYLRERGLPVIVNPFGILYNPFSIANCLEMLMIQKKFTADDLFCSNGLYNSFSHHSRFSGTGVDAVLEQMNFGASEASGYLKNGSHLFITFGTAWVFQYKQSGKVVSNCHKLPATNFNHNRLSVDQITDIWIPLIEQIKSLNPEIRLIFTVSPIRHLKDGAHANQISKSTLLLAIETLITFFGNELISYFPSYEIQLDELRDYRFYARDMAHPGEMALEYIREKFVKAILDSEAQVIINEFEKLIQALNHKPFNFNEPAYITFVQTQIGRIEQLQTKYPFIDFHPMLKKFDEKTTS